MGWFWMAVGGGMWYGIIQTYWWVTSDYTPPEDDCIRDSRCA